MARPCPGITVANRFISPIALCLGTAHASQKPGQSRYRTRRMRIGFTIQPPLMVAKSIPSPARCLSSLSLPGVGNASRLPSRRITAVRLKVEENQLVGGFGEIDGVIDALKGA